MSSAPRRASLPREGLTGHGGHPYHASPRLVAAANTAIALGLPLLLTGEPGCGKTDFASVVAHGLGLELFECHVRSDTRARDLLYSYDALRRFGDAQTSGADAGARARAGDPRHYVRLGGLGLGLLSPRRAVVLIDEIDKAPRDLPNDLLRELDPERGKFEIVEVDADAGAFMHEVREEERVLFEVDLRRTMGRAKGAPMPVVIITSNAERQLPDPFLRRCVFFHIPFPGEAQLPRGAGLAVYPHARGLGAERSAGPVGGRVTQIVTGKSHACALLESGKIRCWGDDELGALGNGTSDPVGDQPEEPPVEVAVEQAATRLVGHRGYFTCAQLVDGLLRCWARSPGSARPLPCAGEWAIVRRCRTTGSCSRAGGRATRPPVGRSSPASGR